MRSVALRALRFALLRRRRALLWSGAALLSVSVWRATAMLLSDVSAEWAEDALDGYAGKVGHWAVLAIVMMGYAIHALRRPGAKAPDLARGMRVSSGRMGGRSSRGAGRIARAITVRPTTRSRVIHRKTSKRRF